MSPRWTPHLTVAALIEEDGQFLMVMEQPQGHGVVLNQPAGHVEEQETLLEAVRREVREETCRHFTPTALSGIYRWQDPHTGITYLRVVFCGSCSQPDPHLQRDPDIIENYWCTPEHLYCGEQALRSPMVLHAIEDYMAGQRLPLTLIRELSGKTR